MCVPQCSCTICVFCLFNNKLQFISECAYNPSSRLPPLRFAAGALKKTQSSRLMPRVGDKKSLDPEAAATAADAAGGGLYSATSWMGLLLRNHLTVQRAEAPPRYQLDPRRERSVPHHHLWKLIMEIEHRFLNPNTTLSEFITKVCPPMYVHFLPIVPNLIFLMSNSQLPKVHVNQISI